MVEHEPAVALLFDDASLSAHLRDALVAHGARIVYESDLRAFAPAELVGSSADVVVVDLDDPSDGDLDRLYETVEGGHPRLKDVPIIMITSRTGEKHRQRAMDIGVNRYLGKPYQEPELMRNVFEMLGLEPVNG